MHYSYTRIGSIYFIILTEEEERKSGTKDTRLTCSNIKTSKCTSDYIKYAITRKVLQPHNHHDLDCVFTYVYAWNGKLLSLHCHAHLHGHARTRTQIYLAENNSVQCIALTLCIKYIVHAI